MENKAVKIIIACVVGVILIGSLLVPIINDANKEISTPYNNAKTAAYLESILDFEDIELSMIVNGSTAELTIDGNTRTEILQGGGNALLFSKNIYIRYDASNAFVLVIDSSSGAVRTTTATAPINVTISDGVITFTDSATEPFTVSVELDGFLFVPNQNGDFQVITSNAGSIYLNDANQIYYAGANNTYAYTGHGGDVSIINTTAEATAGFTTTATVDGQRDLIMVDVGNFKVDLGTESVTPTFFVIPNVVYGHSDVEMQAVTLLYVIPVMLLVALVVMAVSMFRAKY